MSGGLHEGRCLPAQRWSDTLRTSWSRFPRMCSWEIGDACTWPAEVSGRQRHAGSAMPWWLEGKGERGAGPVAIADHVVGEYGDMDGDWTRGWLGVASTCPRNRPGYGHVNRGRDTWRRLSVAEPD